MAVPSDAAMQIARSATSPLAWKPAVGLRRLHLALAEDLAEAALECNGDGSLDGALVEPLDERFEKPLDDQPLSLLVGQAVRAQVVKLLGVDLGDRRRVGAPHVVGL